VNLVCFDITLHVFDRDNKTEKKNLVQYSCAVTAGFLFTHFGCVRSENRISEQCACKMI